MRLGKLFLGIQNQRIFVVQYLANNRRKLIFLSSSLSRLYPFWSQRGFFLSYNYCSQIFWGDTRGLHGWHLRDNATANELHLPDRPLYRRQLWGQGNQLKRWIDVTVMIIAMTYLPPFYLAELGTWLEFYLNFRVELYRNEDYIESRKQYYWKQTLLRRSRLEVRIGDYY